MIDIGYLYIVPIGIAILYMLLKLLLSQNLGRKKPFTNEYTNLLYNLADVMPFKWFIEQDPRHIKALKMNHMIKEADMEDTLDYKSATAMQFSFMFIGIVVFMFVNIALEPIINALAFSFNLDGGALVSDVGTMNIIRISLLFLTMAPVLMIGPYLRKKAKTSEIDFIKDLPLLQLFIILMLRSNRTINEVMHVLSTSRSTYQKTFQEAYLIFLRDPDEAFDYLEEVFDETKLIETIYTLRDFGEYAKEESIHALENNQEEIEEFTRLTRKKAEAGKNLFASVSMFFPFLAVILLGATPMAYWALSLISQAI